MNSTRDNAALYAMQVQVAYARAWNTPWPYIVALGWALFPFALATVLHPSDVIRVQAYMQGLDKPHWFSQQQLTAGCVQALFVLGVLVLVQITATTLFFRQVKLSHDRPATPSLWALAALLTGIFGNGAWLAGTGQFDLRGCIVGFSSVALTIAAEWAVNALGHEFVFGRATGNHPPTFQS